MILKKEGKMDLSRQGWATVIHFLHGTAQGAPNQQGAEAAHLWKLGNT